MPELEVRRKQETLLKGTMFQLGSVGGANFSSDYCIFQSRREEFRYCNHKNQLDS